MRRREFSTFLGCVAALWPLAGHAQQPERVRRIGVLEAFPEADPNTRAGLTAFTRALGRFGWVEGKNLLIEYRFAAGDPTLFDTYAAELIDLSPDAILASTPPAVAALERRTRTIPIVFVLLIDPVGLGVVQGLSRPGGNITGFSSYNATIIGKWLQWLKEIDPAVKRVAMIFNPNTQPFATLFNKEIEVVAFPLGIMASPAPVQDDAGIEEAIATVARGPGGGVIALPDSFNVIHRDTIIAASAHHDLPLIGAEDIFPKAGALLSYWIDTVDVHAQAASYIDRILKGASPADLPVQQPTKFSLVVNLKTAKGLGLTVPTSILGAADEVIE